MAVDSFLRSLTSFLSVAQQEIVVDALLGTGSQGHLRGPLLEAVADNSALTGRRIHMHLLETIYQRAWVDANFPDGIVRYLRDIGFHPRRSTPSPSVNGSPSARTHPMSGRRAANSAQVAVRSFGSTRAPTSPPSKTGPALRGGWRTSPLAPATAISRRAIHTISIPPVETSRLHSPVATRP